jgi:hypothetical protein
MSREFRHNFRNIGEYFQIDRTLRVLTTQDSAEKVDLL